jgi:hypothetical protein
VVAALAAELIAGHRPQMLVHRISELAIGGTIARDAADVIRALWHDAISYTAARARLLRIDRGSDWHTIAMT